MKNFFILIAILVLATAVGLFLQKKEQDNQPLIHEVNETQELTSLKGLVIHVDAPQDGDTIVSPLKVTGKAPGFWFFEADAPIILTNFDGLIIAESFISAKGEWMTEDYVEFEGTIEFTKPEFGERGSLILQKQNASGLPEHADSVEITVYFE